MLNCRSMTCEGKQKNSLQRHPTNSTARTTRANITLNSPNVPSLEGDQAPYNRTRAVQALRQKTDA